MIYSRNVFCWVLFDLLLLGSIWGVSHAESPLDITAPTSPEFDVSNNQPAALAQASTPSLSEPLKHKRARRAAAQSQQSSPPAIALPSAFTAESRFRDLLVATHHTFGTCVFHSTSESTPIACSSDNALHAETLVHPALVVHPSPRRILVLGGVVGSYVREALRHTDVRDAVWVTEGGAEDVRATVPADMWYDADYVSAGRLTVIDMSPATYLQQPDSLRGSFNVIFIPSFTTPHRANLLALAQKALSPGGVLTIHSGPTLNALLTDRATLLPLFPHISTSTLHIPSLGDSHTLLATQSSAPAAPAILSPSFIDTALSSRTTGWVSHYDGITHMRMFALPCSLRAAIAEQDKTMPRMKVDDVPPPTRHAPFKIAALPVLSVQGTTILREFYGCDRSALSSDHVQMTLEHILETMHWAFSASFANATTTGAGNIGVETAMVTIHAAKAHVSVLAYPSQGYAAITITYFHPTAGEEIATLLRHFFNEMDASTSVGGSFPRGAGARWRAVVDDVEYSVDEETGFGPGVEGLRAQVGRRDGEAEGRSGDAGDGGESEDVVDVVDVVEQLTSIEEIVQRLRNVSSSLPPPGPSSHESTSEGSSKGTGTSPEVDPPPTTPAPHKSWKAVKNKISAVLNSTVGGGDDGDGGTESAGGGTSVRRQKRSTPKEGGRQHRRHVKSEL
ncbi:S-adenosyl-L-methionine-dependent methyltransferase [Fimicolochytrium jonesii]|uniref:S-adenosyl-L-methionine-dependent methyltransferase n=1 Tax=Fimicolochytrium jonesii TaxID=1396493 RepID=UPI0022FDD513|nr:S-adenosyl-L-methionine-dependent methyltransferase [Fimicolochytrium jonesii]KAI8817475.1 S-adenosyl-L-methionine-dependent methyltransferase [Fimicolochytrium jonesii]